MYTAFTWVITALALAGVVLNIKKRKECFYIWAFTNFSWMIIDFREGIYSQSLLFAIYFLLALWGVVEWRKGEN